MKKFSKSELSEINIRFYYESSRFSGAGKMRQLYQQMLRWYQSKCKFFRLRPLPLQIIEFIFRIYSMYFWILKLLRLICRKMTKRTMQRIQSGSIDACWHINDRMYAISHEYGVATIIIILNKCMWNDEKKERFSTVLLVEINVKF